ncbi:MAG: hypothetical protein CBB65_12640 [Hyphomonadaceae bacterium TMED5]|nr:hypothetical protein [Ponticaulis sp.]OUX98077.1 MAG: hypothetical protein CBB65_12640 [Hyphomonadaceae bacterium TMED5]
MPLEDLILFLGKETQGFQRHGKPHLAAGCRVWHMTARAFSQPELRILGREMWTELRKGFPHAADGAAVIFKMTGDLPRSSDYDKIPPGLVPNTTEYPAGK